MQFTDCQRTDNHYYSLSDCTDRNVALTDCISASILDKPRFSILAPLIDTIWKLIQFKLVGSIQ